MKPSQRHRKIIELLLQHGQVSVEQLVELLQVSAVTVRNDLRSLERDEKLIRTRGGAAIGKLRGARGNGASGGEPSSVTVTMKWSERGESVFGATKDALAESAPVSFGAGPR